jgi:hypothetical protein
MPRRVVYILALALLERDPENPFCSCKTGWLSDPSFGDSLSLSAFHSSQWVVNSISLRFAFDKSKKVGGDLCLWRAMISQNFKHFPTFVNTNFHPERRWNFLYFL